jgi:APA family basic amino acid/polyamine antiporter
MPYSAPVTSPSLTRRLGLGDAVYIGLGSMIGAGIFAAFTPAAQAAGAGLLVGLLVAAIVAFCNATSSAQLAASYPTSGGTYVYGREQLGQWWGFLAGWSFVIGKTASCAAMALTFAAYAVPQPWGKPVAIAIAIAIAAVIVLAAINYRGITRTALLIVVLVVVVLVVLVVVVAASSAAPRAELHPLADLAGHGWYRVLQSAGLLFFAFAGYARIATMGEEVRGVKRCATRRARSPGPS